VSVIPGLGGLIGGANSGVTSFYLHLTEDEPNVNVYERMGSPTGIVNPIVEIDPGVTIFSTSALDGALDFSGFAVGTTALLFMIGANVLGRGGDGGAGQVWNTGFFGGGGGGGGGTALSLGGPAGSWPPGGGSGATDGQPGESELGGNGGQSDYQPQFPPNIAVGTGQDGGDAIWMGTTSLNIDAGGAESGNIWSGGGGGAGGADAAFPPGPLDGTPGGATGNGSPSWFGLGGPYGTGAPGYSIKYEPDAVLSWINGQPDGFHIRGPIDDGT
jgi:hypothetical protein